MTARLYYTLNFAMKNILIYINPSRSFGEEEKTAIKIQIDNSLDLGWKRKDLLLITNFDYEYNNVKALVVKDDNFCTFCPAASKINAIIDLFKQNLIGSRGVKEDKIYWFHDLDAYQLQPITREIELDGKDILLPDFGRKPIWSTGSFFFKDSSRDIFKLIRKVVYEYKIDEERALWLLTGHNSPDDIYTRYWIRKFTYDSSRKIKNISKRIKKLNISYNFHSFNIRSNYAAALKPIRVAHFHFLERPVNPLNPKPDQIDFFLHGLNKLGVQIVPERLVKIFDSYGIR